MNPRAPPRSALKAASEAVVDYALKALEPEFQCWTAEVNLQVAEFVWNAGGLNLDPAVFHAPGGDLPALVRRLCRLRREVSPEIDEVMLLGLDARHEAGELRFTFELSWDEGDTFHACEIVIDTPPRAEARRN